MHRIRIIGGPGSGKSTLGRALAARLDLPVIHMDAEFWQPGWRPPAPEAWRRRIAALAAEPAWIMEGDYSRVHDLTMPPAEAVVWLDLPRRLYLSRALMRLVRYWGRQRPDMAPGCPERFDWEFLRHWVWTYPKRRAATVAAIDRLRSTKRIVVLRSPAGVRTFVAGLPGSLTAEPGD